nr:hypothetical protein Iba_chr02bCG4430 [Ipomoea batatas]GMC63959.1 hypothetical protein Iba_chr02dCG0330 [Ipomoea batatas]
MDSPSYMHLKEFAAYTKGLYHCWAVTYHFQWLCFQPSSTQWIFCTKR